MVPMAGYPDAPGALGSFTGRIGQGIDPEPEQRAEDEGDDDGNAHHEACAAARCGLTSMGTRPVSIDTMSPFLSP